MNESAVKCVVCGATIGTYLPVDGRVYLLIGAARLRDAWGWCIMCGAEWNWHESDQRLSDLLARLLKNAT
jgi:hypothetical protein